MRDYYGWADSPAVLYTKRSEILTEGFLLGRESLREEIESLEQQVAFYRTELENLMQALEHKAAG